VIVKRLCLAFAGLAALAILAWTTLSDSRFRLGTLAILALFAVKTWVRRNDVMHPNDSEEHQGEIPE
jgi:hypothetical protein